MTNLEGMWKELHRPTDSAQVGAMGSSTLRGITMMIRMMVAVWYMGKRNDRQKMFKITGIYWILRRWHVCVARWSLPTVILGMTCYGCYSAAEILPWWCWGPLGLRRSCPVLLDEMLLGVEAGDLNKLWSVTSCCMFFFRRLYFCGG